jgi:hypothetical protein
MPEVKYIQTNNCGCRINLFNLWVRNFMGVKKYNLKAYSKTFEYALASRKAVKTR